MKKKHFQKNAVIFSALFLFLVIWISGAPAESFNGQMGEKDARPVIVIDPGHGGHDIGAQGPKNKQEKFVTMVMAKAVSRCLESRYNIVLTRNDDYWLDISGRASIANHHGASLFVSIHAGGSYSHQSEGIGIYYYGHMDQFSNASDVISDFSENSGTTGIPWDEFQKSYVTKSKMLAEMVKAELDNNPLFSESKIYEAPILMLSGIKMPCIFIEIGYLTHPETGRKIGDKQWISEFSEKICAGIDAFFKNEQAMH